MTLPFSAAYQTGQTVYYWLVSQLTGYLANTVTVAYEAYSEPNWAKYAIPLTEYGTSGFYWGLPPSWTDSDPADAVLFRQGGGSPSSNDRNPIGIGPTNKANIGMINGVLFPAANLGLAAGTEVPGIAATGTLSTTQMTSNLSAILANVYVGRTVYWLTGTLAGAAATITAYNPTAGLLTFTAVPVAPSNGDTFLII